MYQRTIFRGGLQEDTYPYTSSQPGCLELSGHRWLGLLSPASLASSRQLELS